LNCCVEIIGRNVARLARPPEASAGEAEPFTEDEARRVLHAVRGERLEAYVAVAIAMGLRASEALGLRWEDIDLQAGTLTVRYQLARRGGEFLLEEPKSATSSRTVALPRFAATALQEHRARQLQERLVAGPAWQNALDLVFANEIGAPLHRRNVLRWFQNLLAREGLPVKGIKELRHTAASLLHAQGSSPREIMEVLGHSDVRITMNTYTHIFDEGRRRAADQMDALFTG
jgi:integrase